MPQNEMEKEQAYRALPKLLLPWYRENARILPWRENTDPYRVWISEIMLQQTRVEAVIGYYERFLRELPDIKALAETPEDRLLKLWEGLGYYSRARNLQKAARVILSDYAGKFPDRVEEIRKLPGIGPYTAGAIASISFERAAAAVDGNVLRIIARITGDFRPIDDPKFKKEITANLEAVYPAQGRGDFTQALMELGATVCVPRSPRCDGCPAREVCAAQRLQAVERLPVMPEKKAKRTELKTVFLLECDGCIALTRRAAKGLLAGLWALPDLDGALDESQALLAAENWGVRPQKISRMADRSHIFTHVIWRQTGYHVLCARRDERFVWADREALEGEYALPTAYKQFLSK